MRRNQGFPFRLPDPVIGKKLHAEIPANDPQIQNIEESIGYKRVVLFSLHNSAVRHPAVHIMMIQKKLQELAQALVVIDEGVLINIDGDVRVAPQHPVKITVGRRIQVTIAGPRQPYAAARADIKRVIHGTGKELNVHFKLRPAINASNSTAN